MVTATAVKLTPIWVKKINKSKEPVLEGPLWVRVTVLKESQSAQIGRDAHQKGKETEEIQKKFRGWIKGTTLDRLS